MNRPSVMYRIMAAGGAIGLLAAFLQTLEKVQLLKDKDAILACNFNSIFNCSTVLNAWQSSVFGFPNSLMCMILFTIFATTAVIGAANGKISKGIRLAIHGLALVTLGFALWFLWQSTYVIGALCIFCLFCFAGLLLINWMWLRLNIVDLPISEKGRQTLSSWIRLGYDTLAWVMLGVIVGLAMLLRFND